MLSMTSPSLNIPLQINGIHRPKNKIIGTQCVQSQWRFVPQYGEIYEDNLWISHHCSADYAAPLLPDNLWLT